MAHQGTLFDVGPPPAPSPKPAPKFDADEIRRRFVDVTQSTQPTKWRVAGFGRRGGQVGIDVAVVGFKHGNGYEVILCFDDGKLDSFAPMALFPALDA